MNERDDGNHRRVDEVDIFVRPLERVIGTDGQDDVIFEAVVQSDDPDLTVRAANDFIDRSGAEVLDEQATKAFHALSSTRWNSPWNPAGPKPNWQKPPKNPSLN